MKLPKFYTDLPAQTKKYILFGVLFVCLIGAQQLLKSQQPVQRLKKNSVETVFNDLNTRDISLGAIMAELKKVEGRMNDVTVDNDKMRGQIKELGAQNLEARDKKVNELEGQFAAVKEQLQNAGHKDISMPAGGGGGVGQPGTKGALNDLGTGEEPHPKPSAVEVTADEAFLGTPPAGKTGPLGSLASFQSNPVDPTNAPEAKIVTIAENKTESTTQDAKKLVKRPVPMGILSGTTITGMAAVTGQGGREDPFPELVRVKREMLLPNLRRADLKECFILMSGYGDISSERAILRTEKISCIDKNGKDLEAKISGYAVGEDGLVGIKGMVVRKQGQMIANALLAGTAQGIGQAFNLQPTQSLALTTAGSTVNPAYEQAFSSNSLRAGAAGGVSGAFEMLARWYIQQADSIFPVVEIGAGRLIDVVITTPFVLTEVDGNAKGGLGNPLSGSENAFFNGGSGRPPRQQSNQLVPSAMANQRSSFTNSGMGMNQNALQ